MANWKPSRIHPQLDKAGAFPYYYLQQRNTFCRIIRHICETMGTIKSSCFRETARSERPHNCGIMDKKKARGNFSRERIKPLSIIHCSFSSRQLIFCGKAKHRYRRGPRLQMWNGARARPWAMVWWLKWRHFPEGPGRHECVR